jgi:hypothetical protein
MNEKDRLVNEITELVDKLEQRIKDGKDHFHRYDAQVEVLRWVLSRASKEERKSRHSDEKLDRLVQMTRDNP